MFQVLSFFFFFFFDFWQVKEVEELTIEQGHVNLTEDNELSNQINRIRAEWAADMEEMIYLGWITTCLRHEISTNNKIEERKHELEPEPKLEHNVLPITFEPTMSVPLSTETKVWEEIMEVPAKSNEIEECNDVVQYEPILLECANSITETDENCMDLLVRKGGLNLGKPKLIHKLKGWAKGKGKCKRSIKREFV